MCWCSLLAQETFESYKAICTFPRLRYILTNPYRPEYINQPGYCFFSWPDKVESLGIWLIFLGVLLLWIYKRINVAKVYACMGTGLLGLGLSLMMGFQCAFPHVVYLLISYLSLGFFVAGIAGMLTVVLSNKLPYYGVKEKYLISSATGLPQRYLTFIIGSVILAIAWKFSFSVGDFVFAEFQHNSDIFYRCGALLIVLVGVLGYACIPIKTKYDGFSFNEEIITYVEPLLRINGPAKRKELLYSMIGVCLLFFIVVTTVKQGIDSADFVGMMIISCICLAFVHAENSKSKDFSKVLPKHKRGLWN